MIIDKIYVINLTTPEQEIWDKLDSLNIRPTSCFILNAENGWDIADGKKQPYNDFKVADWWKTESDNDWWNREVTPGEMGCTLSHYYCWKDAFENGYETIMILEEDFYSKGKFPSDNDFKQIPKDWSLIYLSRNALHPEKEEAVNNLVMRTHYSYNTHAYMLSKKGIKELMSSPVLNNVIPSDEFLSGVHGVSDRDDANKIFHNTNFRCYSFQDDYIGQYSDGKGVLSRPSVDNKPEWLNDFTLDVKREGKSFAPGYEDEWMMDASDVDKSEPIALEHDKKKEIPPAIKKRNANKAYEAILDDSDWDKWVKNYINPLLVNEEYDLITDEPAPNVYTFPLFTKRFCKHLIALSEQFDWTTDRHEFYPTTDNLLEVLGMDKIYNKVINEFIRPYAISRYQLEGRDWDTLRDESFIIKYPHNEQSHLSLHHDYSNITTLVNLNPGEFKGGGTYFPKYECLVNPEEIGIATLHPGNITHKHGARPVTEGTRYVVVSFIKGGMHK